MTCRGVGLRLLKTGVLSLAGALFFFLVPGVSAASRLAVTPTVPLNLPAGASKVETIAAAELARYLSRIFPNTVFPVRSNGGIHPGEIHLGTIRSFPEIRNLCDAEKLMTAESFVVVTRAFQGLDTAVVAGADAAGVMHGVYALLERLGCGFYLSDETVPPTSAGLFSFAGWQLTDAPLVRRRIAFNWHNFLSGCTAWDLPQWQQWIVQSQKMRYNTILVHAYGNSPLSGFSFRGVPKEVGFLATTVRGRDWGTAHVNDVRRLVGGTVFDQPVFGAEAAQVPYEQRTDAAQGLMKSVFGFAADRGMAVWFALDIDTMAAQPQEIIGRLPIPGRFQIRVAKTNSVQGAVAGQVWLANPETPDGYAYYKAQAEALMSLYPQIGGLALWIRVNGSTWLEMTPDQFPPAWKEEYAAEIARTPEVAALGEAPGRFALGKVVAAYQRALRELGRGDVELAVGSWRCEWLEASHRLFPKGVTFLPLDYDVWEEKSEFTAPERRARTRRVAQERPVVPIAWAHHDTTQYIGRSYAPFADFQDKLADMKAAGFGIIHWTTRPLDLYFKSLAQQVWSSSKNEQLAVTSSKMADDFFPGEANGVIRDYLRQWITAAPMFGSAMSCQFVVERLEAEAAEKAIRGCKERLAVLDRAERLSMNPESRQRFKYFREMERFCIMFFESERALQSSVDKFEKHDYSAARSVVAQSRPEETIQVYTQAAQNGAITRGEQGILIGLNMGWLPFYQNQREALGLSAARYDFGVTQYETLAQAAGTVSFHVDAQRRFWRKLGPQETGAPAFDRGKDCDAELPVGADETWSELSRDGLEFDAPVTLKLGPTLFDATSPFPAPPPVARGYMPGDYRVRMLFIDEPGKDAKMTKFTVDAGQVGSGASPINVAPEAVQFAPRMEGRPRIHEVSRTAHLDAVGLLQIAIRPVAGKVRLCAVIIESTRP